MDTSVLWRRLDVPGHESCRLVAVEDAWRVEGAAVFAWEGKACRLDYYVGCDTKWRTQTATVEGWVGDESVSVEVLVNSDGHWLLNGAASEEVSGCIDVDLNFSPSTNLLPIRRLELDIGASAEVRAAWLRFPGFKLEPLEQTYSRIDENRFRYESAGGKFVAELEVNSVGLVASYANIWRREAAAN